MGTFILKPNQSMVPSFPLGKYYTKSEADARFAPIGSGGSSPLTTKGDLFTYSTLNARLPVGADGLVLSADSTQATGLKWVAAGTGSGTVTSVTSANGDLSIATTTTTPVITVVSAPKLTTARTINGVAFDGTGNITITSAAGTLTGTTLNSTVVSSSLTTLGTITSGVWNGTAIANANLANGAVANLSGTNTGDQTITLTGAVTGSGTGSFSTIIATPGSLTVSSTNSTATAHTHAITSSSAPGAAASLLATDSSGIIGSTGTRIVKGWFTDITVTNAIAGSITGNAATVTTNANLTGVITSSGNATSVASQTGTGTKFVMDTSPTLITPLLGIPTSGTLTNCTGLPAASVVAGAFGTGAYSMDTRLTVPQILNADNAIAASANAATVTRANRNNVVTNNSATGITITLSITGATAGDMIIVQSLPSSAVAQAITWVNTENSDVTPSANLNASTTSPRTDGFKWNPLTSKWRCIASC